ncbi:MAG: hypothetical protein ABMB14_28675, partial [Myxococcota bacterium]
MDPRRTRPAGGAGTNRAVDERLALPAGEDTVHYRSDDSHAYGSWNADPPDDPEAWGVTVSVP